MILDSSERNLVYDCESDGLLDKVTKIWCIYAKDMDTGEGFLFHDYPKFDNVEGTDDLGEPYKLPVRSGSLKEGALFLHKSKSRTAHNCLGFDEFLMKKFYPKFRIRYNYPEVRDTMLESQVQWFDRRAVKGYKGIHGLAVWGARLGIRKPEIADWSYIDADKLNRCIQDVDINEQVARYLDKERDIIYNKTGLTFTEALTTEHEYRYRCTQQELNGAFVDKAHMEKCIVELDGLIEELRQEIEPQLPPSIVVKGGKCTKHDLFKALGYSKLPAVEYEERERVGVTKLYPIKNWHKPCTKWLNKKVQKVYAVKLDNDIVKDYTFYKLKDAREFVKATWPDEKRKFKYPHKEIEVLTTDSNTNKHFGDTLENIDIIGPFTKIDFKDSKLSQHDKVKELLVGLGWDTDEWTYKKDSDGSFIRAEFDGEVVWPSFKVNGKQLRTKYKKRGLIPVTPQITEDSFVTLPEGLGLKISHYNTYSHRRKFIQNPTDYSKGLLNNIREDGRITCGIMTFGTTAGRASHYNLVNAPGIDSLYGEEIRKIIIASEGCTLVGVDMPNAHNRLLADFTQNETFIKAVDGYHVDPVTGDYKGEDAHTVNSILFTLNDQEAVNKAVETQDHDLIRAVDKQRKIGKGGGFCCLYGGSGNKLAMTIGVPSSEGEDLKNRFLAGLGLDNLLREVESTWKQNEYQGGSYISVLGGYHIHCKSKHKIVNYKALGSEAVMQKVAVIWLCNEIDKTDDRIKVILNMHDEVLLECPDELLDVTKELASRMYPEAAKMLGLTLDWKSSAEVGQSYAVCH